MSTIIKKGKFRLANIIQLTGANEYKLRPVSYGLALEVESEDDSDIYYVISFLKWDDNNNIKLNHINNRFYEAIMTEEDCEVVLDLLMKGSQLITAARLFDWKI